MGTMKEQLKCKVIGKVELKPKVIHKAVIVTSNPAFAEFIKKHAGTWGYNEVRGDTPILTKVSKHDEKERVVFGIIPNYLGKHAISVVELEIILPSTVKKSKNKLTLKELEKYVTEEHIHEYVISVLKRN